MSGATLSRIAVLCVFWMFIVSPPLAAEDDRVAQATKLILKLCIATGRVEITTKGDSIEVAGKQVTPLQIDRSTYSGLVGGISKEITALQAQQASAARSCTQRYLQKLLDIFFFDNPGNQAQGSARPTVGSQVLHYWQDPDAFWGGRGIWNDNHHYCEQLREFLAGSFTPGNFIYIDNGERVSLDTLTRSYRKIEGNFMMRTEPGSTAHFCGVYDNTQAPTGASPALACSRVVSDGHPDVFASVYNQTLKDMRDCLLPTGWKQAAIDQGACIPQGTQRGECIRTFVNGHQSVWLFSNVEHDSYSVGIQTGLGGY